MAFSSVMEMHGHAPRCMLLLTSWKLLPPYEADDKSCEILVSIGWFGDGGLVIVKRVRVLLSHFRTRMVLKHGLSALGTQ